MFDVLGAVGKTGVEQFITAAIFYLAWNVQMGLHEGGHAIVADRLGDRVPRMYGKVTINPYKHIEWDNPNYVISAVVMPAITALMGWIPIGMAWVPISPHHSTANHAKIALAGPLGSLAAMILGFVLWFVLLPLLLLFVDSKSGLQVFWLVQTCCVALVTTGALYGALNLIPIPPLDGSNIAYHYMNPEGRRLMDDIRPYGFFIFIIIFWILPTGKYVFGPIFEAVYWVMDLISQVWI